MTLQKTNESYMNKALILTEALPYIQRLNGKTVIIKYGGNAMIDEALQYTIFQDIALLKSVGVNPIIVHGGGPDISNMLSRLSIESHFVDGLRVTDGASMEVVQMVLAGKLNKDIVASLSLLGVKAIGLCGKDAGLLKVRKKVGKGGADLGFVGEIVEVNARLLTTLAQDEYIPVIAPVGVDENGQSYNINADTVAGEIAVALEAEKLMFLTDIDGIYLDRNDPNTLLPVVTIEQIHQFIEDGTIDGGMIPKVQGCIRAVEQGVKRTHIVNGTIPHPIVLEIFTDSGIGTMVTMEAMDAAQKNGG